MRTEIVGHWVLTPGQSPTVKLPLLRRPNQFRIFFAWLLLGFYWEDAGQRAVYEINEMAK